VRLFGLMPAGVNQCFIRSSISSGTGYVIRVSPAKSSASSHCLGRQRVPGGAHQCDAFIAKQGTEDDGVLRFLAVVDDGEFGFPSLEQR